MILFILILHSPGITGTTAEVFRGSENFSQPEPQKKLTRKSDQKNISMAKFSTLRPGKRKASCNCPLDTPIPAPGIKQTISGYIYDASQERDHRLESFVMTKKISTFAIIACLASSLAFASDKAKPASSGDATATTAATSDNANQKDNSPCGSAKHTNKAKVKARPALSNQEQEFDRVLRGIYG
jgi:hypothetical protein